MRIGSVQAVLPTATPYQAPPRRARRPPELLAVTETPQLTVGRTQFTRIGLADLSPGDIAFQYVPHPREFRQKWIGVGNLISNFWRPSCWADPGVMHTFVLVSADPQTRTMRTVDAAGGNFTDVTEVTVDFNTGERVPPGARYVFFRAKDRRTQQRIVTVAQNWASPGLHNFSFRHAVASPFRSAAPNERSWRRALEFFPQSDIKAPLTDPETGGLYQMMCSEFVVTVCVAATLQAWHEAHPDYVCKDLLRGLYDGEMGDAFAVDGKGLTPALLMRHMEACPGMAPVGFIDALS